MQWNLPNMSETWIHLSQNLECTNLKTIILNDFLIDVAGDPLLYKIQQ